MATDYSFSEQQKNFIKLQFKYGVRLHQKLEAGEISQAYYDRNIWLTTETLDSPYPAFWNEFKTAIESENVAWLAQQIGEDVQALAAWVGTTAGGIVGNVVSGVAGGFTSALNLQALALIIGAGVVAWWAFTRGPLSAFKVKSI
jgi:hypothetical protein